MAEKFPFLLLDDIDRILKVCEKNDGLSFYPEDDPLYLFGFWRFYPPLIDAIEAQDFDVLEKADLKHGPLVYIAAYIAPWEAYYTLRNLLRGIEGARGFAFHRFRNGRWRFNLVRHTWLFEKGMIQ